jgi:arginyl-tRNA synthetase
MTPSWLPALLQPGSPGWAPLAWHAGRARGAARGVASVGRLPPRGPTMIRDELADALRGALATLGMAAPDGGIELTVPKQRAHGDWATNLALRLGAGSGRSPRHLADELAAALAAAPPRHLDRVEVAGPGFLNFHLAPGWLHDVLREVVAAGSAYGRSDRLAGRRVNLEFVSANPTGPLHAGGGRWVAVGDAIANLLAAQGAQVHREYYLNDAGTQLDAFAASLHARYEGREPPEDGYHGAYLVEMAARMRAELGDAVGVDEAREWGYRAVVDELRTDLRRVGVEFDTWFSERELHARGSVDAVLDDLRQAGHTYEHEGALWLASHARGDSRDRVLVRSDGTTTYLANDLAYHRDKFERGFNHLIDIWGADHHGQVKSLQVGMEMLGYPPGQPEILLGQLVTLVRDGAQVRLSKRTGNVVTLADILDEVDPDVARLTFLLQGLDKPQTFDLDVVTAQSMENPVYYVQMAHARIASIGRRAAAAGVERLALDDAELQLLTHERELELLRSLAVYPEVVAEAADARAPHRVTTWVHEFAAAFHGFYADCRVLSDDAALTQARLWLAEACRIGLADALGLLGVSVPEEMARLDGDASGAG